MTEMEWHTGTADCTEIFEIRKEVFIREQGFQNEFDDTDKHCRHLLLRAEGIPAGCARIYQEKGCWHLGRLAVLKQYRERHYGAALVLEAERMAAALGADRICLSAQVQALKFYEKLGYTAVTGVYLDEFCPHMGMEKILKNKISLQSVQNVI